MRGSECPQESNVQVHPVVAWISRKHSIVISRKPLRLGERLFSPSGATGKVRMPGKHARVVSDDPLGRFRHYVDGAVAPIDDLFRMPCCELKIFAAVTRVCTRGGKTALQCIG